MRRNFSEDLHRIQKVGGPSFQKRHGCSGQPLPLYVESFDEIPLSCGVLCALLRDGKVFPYTPSRGLLGKLQLMGLGSRALVVKFHL